MKNDNTHNGWTNYATWRVNLEFFDGQSPEDIMGEHVPVEYSVLEEQLENYLEEQGQGLVLDYALAFISDVNWYEIAQTLVEEYKEEHV